MTAEYAQTDRFRGARIHLCDLAGLEIRDCEVSGLKIVDCYLGFRTFGAPRSEAGVMGLRRVVVGSGVAGALAAGRPR